MDARYKNWWISHGWYPWIFPRFIWEIFGHVIVLDQSRANKNIWLIIMVDINRAAKRRGNIHCQPPTLQWIFVLVYTETARRCSTKYDFNWCIPATSTTFSHANPAQIAWRWIAKATWSLSSQAERIFNAIHCFSRYLWVLWEVCSFLCYIALVGRRA